MNKPSRSIDEQINLLKRRGMLFHDEDTAKNTLKNISYYRLKGYWWEMQNAQLFQKHLKELQNEFARSGEIFVKDFKHKHPSVNEDQQIGESPEHPDAWLIFEVATFGNLSKIYKNLRHQLPQKAAIANEFGLNLHSELSSWLESVAYLRNIVAHHSRIWSRTMVKKPMEVLHPRNVWLQLPIPPQQQKKPFYIISTMLYLCNAVKKNHLFKSKLFDLFSKYPNLPLYKIGFHNQWKLEDLWK